MTDFTGSNFFYYGMFIPVCLFYRWFQGSPEVPFHLTYARYVELFIKQVSKVRTNSLWALSCFKVLYSLEFTASNNFIEYHNQLHRIINFDFRDEYNNFLHDR